MEVMQGKNPRNDLESQRESEWDIESYRLRTVNPTSEDLGP